MPFNGSGTFNALTAPNFPAVSGSVIFANRFNANVTDLHQGLSNCITRDGQSPAQANLPMGGFKLTGLAAGSVAGDSLRFEQLGAATSAITDVHMAMRGEITTATNLDTLTSPGSYSITVLTSCTNFPTDGIGMEEITDDNATLLVVKGTAESSMISQTIVTESGRTFVRSYLESWSDWSEVNAPGQTIASGIDFNDLIVSGDYFISNALITSCTHRPQEYVSTTLTDVSEGGILRVVARGDRRVQVFLVNSGREYTRFYQGGSWQNWTCRYPTFWAGNFTPSLTAESGTTGISYVLRTGNYWRVGPLIFYSAMLWFSHDGSWSRARLNLPVAPIDFVTFLNGPIGQATITDTIATTYGSFYTKIVSTTASDALALYGFIPIDGEENEINGTIPTPAGTVIHYSGWYIAAANA